MRGSEVTEVGGEGRGSEDEMSRMTVIGVEG